MLDRGRLTKSIALSIDPLQTVHGASPGMQIVTGINRHLGRRGAVKSKDIYSP